MPGAKGFTKRDLENIVLNSLWSEGGGSLSYRELTKYSGTRFVGTHGEEEIPSLSSTLRSLSMRGLIDKRGSSYELTPEGESYFLEQSEKYGYRW